MLFSQSNYVPWVHLGVILIEWYYFSLVWWLLANSKGESLTAVLFVFTTPLVMSVGVSVFFLPSISSIIMLQ